MNIFFKTALTLSAFVFVFGSLLLSSAPVAQAAEGTYGLNETATAAKIPTGGDSLQKRIGTIINGVFVLVGVLFLSVIMYAAVLWITAGGNEDRLGKAKKLIGNSIVGIVILFLSYALVSLVLSIIGSATTAT